MKPLVLYHADCTDGYGAAFAAWMALGDSAEYLPVKYGDIDTHLEYTGRELYILDFSFPREVMEHMFSNAAKVAWLDHHASVFKDWGLPIERINNAEECEVGLHHHIVLDNNKSGAMLAWEYFHPDASVPLLIRYIDDRDRWQWKLEGSAEIHAALQARKPWSFEQWQAMSIDEPHHAGLYTEGKALLRAQKQQIESMVKQGRECMVAWSQGTFNNGSIGRAANAPLHMSELGHELANQSGTFGLVWYVGADNKVKLSFRSNGDYDVSAIAKALGGGGHKNAAGAETDIGTLMGWLR